MPRIHLGTTLAWLVLATLHVAAQEPGSTAHRGRSARATLAQVSTPRILPGTRPDVFATIQGNALTSTNGSLPTASSACVMPASDRSSRRRSRTVPDSSRSVRSIRAATSWRLWARISLRCSPRARCSTSAPARPCPRSSSCRSGSRLWGAPRRLGAVGRRDHFASAASGIWRHRFRAPRPARTSVAHDARADLSISHV